MTTGTRGRRDRQIEIKAEASAGSVPSLPQGGTPVARAREAKPPLSIVLRD
jgi:hypothetical protein